MIVHPQPQGQTSLSLLRTRRYGLFWISSLFSNIGTWMQQVAQPWVILSMNGSSFWVGLDSFAMNAPGWVFTLWGGALADRFDRKRIILFFQTVQFFAVLILLILLATGTLKLWMIIVASFVVGSTDSISMPAFQSIIPSLVEKDEIPRAVALNSTQFNLSRVLGPAIAGVVLTRYGSLACFGSNLISFIPFFLSIYWIYPRQGWRPQDESPDTHGDGRTRDQDHKFFHIIRDPSYRLPLLTILITSIFCSPLITFCPVLVKNVFHGGPDDLGWATASFGAGGVAGALLSSVFANSAFTSRGFAGTVALLLGALVVCVALAPSLIIMDVGLALAGAALTLTNTSVNSRLQKSAHNRNRGRVVSLFQFGLHAGISAGSLLTGTLTTQFGIGEALIANGVAVILLQGILLTKGTDGI